MKSRASMAALTLVLVTAIVHNTQAATRAKRGADDADDPTRNASTTGSVWVDITDVNGHNLPAVVELRSREFRKLIHSVLRPLV